jgi:hypothetical protein
MCREYSERMRGNLEATYNNEMESEMFYSEYICLSHLYHIHLLIQLEQKSPEDTCTFSSESLRPCTSSDTPKLGVSE